MINVVCVKWGDLYTPDYVNILFDSVRRNMPVDTEYQFICFTDNSVGLLPEIVTKPLPAGLWGWWNKMYLFKQGVLDGRVVYFDLDTVIVDSISEIIHYKGDFAILRDFYRPNGWQSSVMAWDAAKMHRLWDEFEKQGYPVIEGGDQSFIEMYQDTADLWQDMFPESFVSYKAHCVKRLPANSKVVVFHGLPRPHMVKNQWMDYVWKVGGMKPFDYDLGCNADDETLINNIKYAIGLDKPWFTGGSSDEEAIVIAGGPSINDYVDIIRGKSGKIYAVNNAYQWCVDNDIYPHYHVILDARHDNAKFATGGIKMYSSQCCPELTQKADIIWHPLIDGIQELLPDVEYALVGGGCTVGLKTMAIAALNGHKRINVFGMDSSYSNYHHAYEQSLNDNDLELTVTVEGKTFKCSPWMAQQADEYQQFARVLIEMGIELCVYGSGLIPYLTELMGRTQEDDDQIVAVDGIWWPSKDVECRTYTNAYLNDINHFMQFCLQKRTAIQAGGNVGLFPKILAKHFDSVLTFEPDALNFECLALNANAENIKAVNCAVGYERKKHSLVKSAYNCGAHYIKEGDDFQTVRIDDYKVDNCDLLQLDVEGFEFEALKGAEETIAASHPVIVLELKGHEERYGATHDQIVAWLKERGYNIASKIHRDIVFVHNKV